MTELRNVSKAYGEKVVLDRFSCSFPDSGFVVLSGKSGAGKTTLLRLILDLEKADQGDVIVPEGSVISVVFQEDRLLERFSSLENVTVVSDDPVSLETIKKAELLLKELGLENDISTRVSSLSGGMKRRVAIARCLMKDADIYIMDEPIKGLDSENRRQTLDVIKKYTAGKLLLMVSHNPEDSEGADMILTI